MVRGLQIGNHALCCGSWTAPSSCRAVPEPPRPTSTPPTSSRPCSAGMRSSSTANAAGLPVTRLCRGVAGLLGSLALVSGKSERRAARSVVADYHHAQLGELVAHVGEAVDRQRAGELDAFDVDHVLFQYSRAAKELWKFCNSLEVEVAAAMIRDQPPRDWWNAGLHERGNDGRIRGIQGGTPVAAPRAGRATLPAIWRAPSMHDNYFRPSAAHRSRSSRRQAGASHSRRRVPQPVQGALADTCRVGPAGLPRLVC